MGPRRRQRFRKELIVVVIRERHPVTQLVPTGDGLVSFAELEEHHLLRVTGSAV